MDENPENNGAENLAVLCLECHNQTQVRGGFGSSLSEPIVRKYRDEWQERVKARRAEADSRAVALMVGKGVVVEPDRPIETFEYSEERADSRLRFVEALPVAGHQLREVAQAEWDSGVTARIVNGSYDYVNALESLLVQMSKFYPSGTFGNAVAFFADQVAARYRWHRSYALPDGPMTGGTIVNVTVSSAVVDDVEKMVEDMAMALVGYDDRFDWKAWPSRWRGKAV